MYRAMENPKKLVIVPPMSTPLQKLNEVLEAVANDENIDISIVDDPKELNQFIGSAGQVLVLFSNAKKCATFLQDNRFQLAKNHSKVILLTPKEIPAKTLVKFVKIGLTESILEGAPPKTLLYKVKLLLRSIKSSASQEEKDHVVKSMSEGGYVTPISDLDDDKKIETKIETISDEKELSGKIAQVDKPIDYGESLKGKSNFQEDAIATHWKSKRKKDDGNPYDANDINKIEDENTIDVDMYYRGKTEKKQELEISNDDDTISSKNDSDLEESTDNEKNYKKKSYDETELNLESNKKNKNEELDEEEAERNYKLKETKEYSLFDSENDLLKENTEEEETPESKALKLKTEMDELEALFADAVQRQKEIEEEEEKSNNLKNNADEIEFEENENQIEKNDSDEYEGSGLKQRKKVNDNNLFDDEDQENNTSDEEDEIDQTKKRREKVDIIDGNLTGSINGTDDIDLQLESDISETKAETSSPIEFLKNSKDDNPDEEEEETEKFYKERKSSAELDISGSENSSDETEEEQQTEELRKIRKNDEDNELGLESDDNGNNDGDENNKDDNSNLVSKQSSAALELQDAEKERAARENDETSPHMSFIKLAQTNLDLDNSKGGVENHGKVDQIDTFYRSGEAKKTEHSWENLSSKTQNANFQVEKNIAKDSDYSSEVSVKNNGEITIDYRKLKKEFDEISRNGPNNDSEYQAKINSLTQQGGDEEDTFKVIEPDFCGFDFGIEVLNLIFQNDSKAIDFYKIISEELITKFKAYSVFYTFKTTEEKHTEIFDSFNYFGTNLVRSDLKEWWFENKSNEILFTDYFSKRMTTWLCREIEDKSNNGNEYWEDVELPKWADNELTNKKVELIFPYFDGLDKMGVAIVYLPDGFRSKDENSLIITLEMARTVLLESIQRKIVLVEPEQAILEESTEKKNISNMFSDFFNKKKVG